MPSGPSIPGANVLGAGLRAGEVTATLARFGFGEFLGKTGLDRFLGSRSRAEDGSIARAPLPERVRMLLEELGPTFVKGGQILSTRPDLVPEDWITELKKLQADVPPAPWEGEDGVQAVLKDELGPKLDEAFESIEPRPLAAASVAQVHRATLKGGEEVVVKVLRPGIREQMSADMELLGLFARMARGYLENIGFDAEAVVSEFKRQLERETDLLTEAASTQRMRSDFLDHEGVKFPRVYAELCTRSVLVLEQVHGTLLNRLDTSTLSRDQREAIVRNGADAVFRQCLVLGFFHADPHPGNMFVLEGEKLCFIDCGMTGLIDPGTMSLLAQITHGAIEGDLDRIVKVTVELAGADPRLIEDRAFRSEAYRFVDRFRGGSIESIRMGNLLEQFFGLLRKHRLRCPADIVYLIKALTTIEGVAEDIAPEFDLVSYVRPYVERLIKERYGMGAVKRRLQNALIEYSDLIEELPQEVGSLLRALRTNQIAVRLEHQGLDKLTGEIERASMNISWSLGIAALIVGSSVVLLADSVTEGRSALTTLAAAGLGLAAVLTFVRLFQLWRRN
ncbi:MAG: ABC1 kinase family protein [Phycisphaerales bacterium JB039]